MMRSALLIPLLGAALAGCSGGSQASVSADEEEMFKNPPPVDRSKIPANAFETKGPAFVGEPTKGSGGGTTPPAAKVGG